MKKTNVHKQMVVSSVKRGFIKQVRPVVIAQKVWQGVLSVQTRLLVQNVSVISYK